MFNHVIVLPTMSCNCRCPYCYEDHEAVNMSGDVVESIERFLVLQKNKGSTSLHLEFFGGEPLLCLDKVLNLSSFAQKLFSDSNNQYYGSMTTNAVLLNPEGFRRLNAAGVRGFHITLGPKEIHDTERVLVDGRGTFEVIWNNLICMQQSDLSFDAILRLHITPDSLERVVEFSKKELSVFLADKRFKFYYHALMPLGGKHDRELNMYTHDEAKEVSERLESQVTYKYSKMCYAGNPHSIVILPNGDLCKCTVMLGQSVCGKLLSDGTVNINNELFSIWCIPYLHPEKNIKCPKNEVPELQTLYPIS